MTLRKMKVDLLVGFLNIERFVPSHLFFPLISWRRKKVVTLFVIVEKIFQKAVDTMTIIRNIETGCPSFITRDLCEVPMYL